MKWIILILWLVSLIATSVTTHRDRVQGILFFLTFILFLFVGLMWL